VSESFHNKPKKQDLTIGLLANALDKPWQMRFARVMISIGLWRPTSA
jgi:hypothetical protein